MIKDELKLFEFAELVKARDFRLRLIKATLDSISKELEQRSRGYLMNKPRWTKLCIRCRLPNNKENKECSVCGYDEFIPIYKSKNIRIKEVSNE